MDAGFDIIPKSSHSGRIPELYNRIAGIYDLFTGYEPRHHREAILVAGIEAGDSVLEVACGTGRATAEIAKMAGSGVKIYAVDITEAMLKKAKKRLRKKGLDNRVRLQQADARMLPFRDEAFDVLFNAYMFDLLDTADMPGIISEFRRVLKPGGKLVLVDTSKEKKGRTLYERLYAKGLLGFASGGCRPVYMKPYLDEAGFEKTERLFGGNRSWFILLRLSGTEIVWGSKPGAGRKSA